LSIATQAQKKRKPPVRPSPGYIETLRLANGLRLQYRQTGEPNGIPMILLHGVTDSLRSWQPFTDALPRSIRAVAISQRGHGDSSKPADDYGSSAFAGDLAAFMDAMGLQRAHIVTHSMSTWIAQRFARDYPERISSLTLMAGFVTLAGNPAAGELTAAIVEMDTIDPAFARAFQESTVAKPMPPQFLSMVVSESLKVPAHVWRATFTAMLSEELEPTWIACPTLLIGGAKDELFDDGDRRALAAVFPNSREILYPDLGHAPHWEDPARVARDVAACVGAMALA
jgi:non-heme chloroperoxidase